MYSIALSDKAIKDLPKLKKENKMFLSKLMELVADIATNPFTGLGKPEKLKHDMVGCYSRRISDKHRLIYNVNGNVIEVISCYGHYSDK